MVYFFFFSFQVPLMILYSIKAIFQAYKYLEDQSQRILEDPGADNGGEGKSKRVEKYKVKNGEKSPWGQCLTRPVPNGLRRSGF